MGKIFFASHERIGSAVTLAGQAAHHLVNVLRLHLGDTLILCDGCGMDYNAYIHEIYKNPVKVIFHVKDQQPSLSEMPIKITLFQGYPKGDKLDWIIEKCVELGVCEIQPVITEHSLVKQGDFTRKLERLSKIAMSAAAQSMRSTIPIIHKPDAFNALTQFNPTDLHIMAYEGEKTVTLRSALHAVPVSDVSLWVGPEGGFSQAELHALVNINAVPFSLGPRILRTETAALAAISQIQAIWDVY